MPSITIGLPTFGSGILGAEALLPKNDKAEVHHLLGDVEERLWELGAKSIRDIPEKLALEGCKIFMDGRFIGYVEDGERLAKAFRKLRREGQIHPSASVMHYEATNKKGWSPRDFGNPSRNSFVERIPAKAPMT